MMGYFCIVLLSFLVAGCIAAPTPAPEAALPPQPVVRIHYLGHASFLLQFDNEVSVLTDYGQSNSNGLDSPIYDWAGPEPQVVTFSHIHPGHKRPGLRFEQARKLSD